MRTIDRPIRFPGTDAEIDANIATHNFWTHEGGTRCVICDCRPWGVSATWPCGAEVPRETVTVS